MTRISLGILIVLQLACTVAEHPSDSADTGSDSGADSPAEFGTGTETDQLPVFFRASDVDDAQLAMAEADYAVASEAWGNFGPLEYWIVGTDSEAAAELDAEYCDHRVEMDPSLTDEYVEHCLDRGYDFEDYAQDGGAALSIQHGEDDEYSVFVITLASKYPFPDESDYTVVGYHEYFHVVQSAHIATRDYEERQALMVENPWWSEGGASYMGELLYSRQPGVAPGYLAERMTWKMQTASQLEEGESIADISYGERAMVAYELGAWFIAFLIDRVGEEVYLNDFYDDLNSLDFEGAFVANFGMSSEEMLADFHAFLELPLSEQLAIIP